MYNHNKSKKHPMWGILFIGTVNGNTSCGMTLYINLYLIRRSFFKRGQGLKAAQTCVFLIYFLWDSLMFEK